MALFKMRKGGDESPATPRPESIEAMRRRARHRLIGAAVLVLLGVLGFPVLFDTQPRPISVDIPIEIPDRNKVKPLPAPAAVQAPAVSGRVTAPPVTAPPLTAPPVTAPPAVAAVAPAAVPPPSVAKAPDGAASRAQSKSEPKAEARTDTKTAAKPEAKSEPKSDAKSAAASPDTAPEPGARALALLDGKPVSAAAASDGRYVVQVGAFADATKAREVRRKVEKAGLKTYTNVADTKEGKRIRVRVGPFASKTDADKAAGKLKGLDLPAAVLTL